MCAPQRRQISTISRTGSAATRSTLGREEDGYDGPSGAVAEWLGRGLQSLVQRFESARRLRFFPGRGRQRRPSCRLGTDPRRITCRWCKHAQPSSRPRRSTSRSPRSSLAACSRRRFKEEEPAELWFELGNDDGEDVSRLSIDLSYTDIEELLRLSPEDEIALSLDGEAVESLFGDAGRRGARPEGRDRDRRDERCDPRPGRSGCGSAVRRHGVDDAAGDDAGDGAGVGVAATTQVSSLAAKTQVSACRRRCRSQESGREGQRLQASPERARAVATRLHRFRG